MKLIQKTEILIGEILLCIFILLIIVFNLSRKFEDLTVLNPKIYLSTLQYKEITETYDKVKGMNEVSSLVSYIYPNKLRIEKYGKIKSVEIYNGKSYIYYDNMGKISNIRKISSKIFPKVFETTKLLDKIIKSKEFEFFGYEERENKKLMVIGVIEETGGALILHKYWIEEVNNIKLPFREECFVDNSVVSQTTYIYLKVNESIDAHLFDIP